jgi:hypothetical protein
MHIFTSIPNHFYGLHAENLKVWFAEKQRSWVYLLQLKKTYACVNMEVSLNDCIKRHLFSEIKMQSPLRIIIAVRKARAAKSELV